MKIAHLGGFWLPLLAVCAFAMIIYTLLAFAGVAPMLSVNPVI